MSADPSDNLPETFTDAGLKDWLDAELEERRGKVLLLKLSGATYATIAAECGISMSTARKDYQIALSAHMEESPEVGIAKHRAIISDVLRANYPAMLGGDKDAAQTILKALDRDAKLKGYDAPTRVLASVNTRDFANEAAQLINRIQALDPDTLKELTRVHRPQRPILDAIEEPLDVEPDPSPAPAPDDAQPTVAEDKPAGAPGPAPEPPAGLVHRRRPAPAPGSEGGAVADPEGLGLQGTLGLPFAASLDRPVRPAGEPGSGGEDRQAAADPEPEHPVADDLDGWSNIEDD